LWAVENEAVRGPLNAVMPQPVTNADFTRYVAHAVHRPAILPAPAFLLRLCLGEMASMLLDSVRVRPAVAERGHYRYSFVDVPDALIDIAR
jgi:NAD dependent epimerase/dehydratase family enzyme